MALGSLVVKLALEYAQFTQGLDKSSQEALRFGKNVQDSLNQASRSASDFLGGLVTGALGALASYKTLEAAIGGVRDAINRADEFQKLSQRIGVSANALQELAYAGSLADVSLETLAIGAKKLSQYMAEAVGGGKEQAAVFRALGIEYKNADGTLRSVNDVMADVAGVFEGLEDGAVKTALAMKLFGKSGADLIPLLNGGKKAFKESADEARRFGLVVGEDARKAAEAFNDNMTRLGKITQGTFNQFAAGVTPVLVEFTNAMVDAASGTGSLNDEAQKLQREGTITEWALAGAKALTYVLEAGENVWRLLKAIGQVLGAALSTAATSFSSLGAAFTKLLAGDFSGAWQAITSGARQAGAVVTELGKDLNDTLGAATLGKTIRDRIEGFKGLSKSISDVSKNKPSAALLAALGPDAAKAIEDARKALEKWQEQIASYNTELEAQYNQTTKLSKAEQWLAELTANNTKATQLLTEKDRERLKVETQLLVVKERRNLIEDLARKREEELAKESADAVETQRKTLQSYEAQNESLVYQGKTIGKTREELAYLEAQRLLDAAAAREQLAVAIKLVAPSSELADIFLQQAEALRKAAEQKTKNARDQTFYEAQKREADQLIRLNERIGESLADALIDGGKRALDYIKNLFRNTVLRPLVQAALAPVTGALSGAVQAFTGADQGYGYGGTASGAVGSAFNYYSAGQKLYEGFSSGFAGLSDAGASAYSYVTGAPTGSSGATAAGNVASYAGAAVAGYVAGKAISGGYSAAGGQSGNTLVVAGEVVGGIIGAIVGNPQVGIAIGGAIGGLINRAFGRKAPEVTGRAITGSFTGGDFAGQAETTLTAKGGFFRSDKVTQVFSELSADVNKALDEGGRQMLALAKVYGDALGLPVEKLADVSAEVKIAVTDSLEDTTKAVGDALGAYAEALLGAFTDELEPLRRSGESVAQVIERVGGTLLTVNKMFDTLGLRLIETSVNGGAAAVALADLFGGAGNLASALSAYYGAFYSKAEQTDKLREQLTASFAAYGAVLPRTREEFRALVEQLSSSGAILTEAGRQQFAALISVSGAFDQLVSAEEELAAATEEAAARIAAKTEEVFSNLDGIISDFISGADLATYRAQRIADQLADAGINVSAEQVIGATKEDIKELWGAVGDDGKIAIEKAYGAWKELQKALLQSQIDDLIQGIAGSASELAGAYEELNPQAKTLVQTWRDTVSEIDRLRGALDEIDGTGAVDAVGALRAAVANRSALSGVVSANQATAFDIRVGQGGQQAVDLLRRREADLWREFASTGSAEVAQAITKVTLDRIKLEGTVADQAQQKLLDQQYANELAAFNERKKLQDAANKEQVTALNAQIDAAQRLKALASDLPQFLGSLRAGSLSNLSYSGRLDQQRQLFQTSLQTGVGAEQQLTAYLQQAQQIYGGATAEYSAIFNQALAEYQAAVTEGAAGADDTISIAQEQLAALSSLANEGLPVLQKAITDTSDAQVAALESLNAAFGDKVAEQTETISALRKPLEDQLALLEAQRLNQEVIITQLGEALSRMQASLQSIDESLDKQASADNLVVAAGP